MNSTIRKEGIQVNRNRFEGKVALVTGAGSPRGIGRATALALAREGAKVAITDIVADNVKRVVSELTEISQAIGEVADVRNKDQMVQVVKRTTEALGGLDILVNNAGLTRPTLFLDISEEEYDLVLDVNLKGTFLTTQAAVPAMLERGSGAIISLSSVSGQRGGGVFGTSAYSAAKAGIMGLTKALEQGTNDQEEDRKLHDCPIIVTGQEEEEDTAEQHTKTNAQESSKSMLEGRLG